MNMPLMRASAVVALAGLLVSMGGQEAVANSDQPRSGSSAAVGRGENGAEDPDRENREAPTPTAEQIEFIKKELGQKALEDINKAMAEAPREEAPRTKLDETTRAFPIAAVAIAATAWCARGALASIPTSVVSDIINGKPSGKETYVKNAVAGCLVGEVGGWAWRVLPGWVKKKAVELVLTFILKNYRP
jgi:hypothetical protein